MDMHSGKVLAEKQATDRFAPASITKLMTAYVVFNELKSNRLSLTEKVTISKKAWKTKGSRMFVEVNKKVAVEDLIKGMIIQSGNDAAVALAEHIAGSEATFAQLMNRYASALGMNKTNFMNATGWPDPDHYSTAADIAELSRRIIADFPEYYAWYAEKQFTFNNITQYNRNNLLRRDSTVDGLKTGHTDEAGYCLAASAQKEGMRLISVVLGTKSAKQREDQSQALLKYGFRFFDTRRVYGSEDVLETTKIWKGEQENLRLGLETDLYVTVPRREVEKITASVQLPQPLMAPVTQGQPIGKLLVKIDGEVITEAPVVALDAVEEGGWWSRLVDEVKLKFE